MPFIERKVLHTTSDVWVGAGTTSATSRPLIADAGLIDAYSAVITAEVTVGSYSAGTFTATAGTDLCEYADHEFVTGLKVRVSNSGGALPTGLSAATDYFVIVVDTDNFYLATSLANALAGTRIDITSAGTGTHTVTPQALAGASLKLQGTIDDGVTWVDVPNESESITASSTVVWELDGLRYPRYRIYPTLTAGSMTISASVLGQS